MHIRSLRLAEKNESVGCLGSDITHWGEVVDWVVVFAGGFESAFGAATVVDETAFDAWIGWSSCALFEGMEGKSFWFCCVRNARNIKSRRIHLLPLLRNPRFHKSLLIRELLSLSHKKPFRLSLQLLPTLVIPRRLLITPRVLTSISRFPFNCKNLRMLLQPCQFLFHHLVFSLQMLHISRSLYHVFQFWVFLLQRKQLLMQIMLTSFPFEIQNVFQMLNFFLKLQNQLIVSLTDCICANFRQDHFCPVCEFQSWDGFLWMVDNRWNSCNQSRFCVSTQRVL